MKNAVYIGEPKKRGEALLHYGITGEVIISCGDRYFFRPHGQAKGWYLQGNAIYIPRGQQ